MIELLYSGVIAVIAVGLGRWLLRHAGCGFGSLAEELSFSLGVGLASIALGVMVLGFFNILYAWILYALVGVASICGCREIIGLVGKGQGRFRGGSIPWQSFYLWLGVFVGIGVLLNLLRALTPVYGAVDPLAYHLALPKIYLQQHGLSFEPTINGALYPSNIGMLFTLGLGLHGAILAQLLHFGMGVSCLVFVGVFCRRFFNIRVGLWAVAIFSSLPVFAYFGSLAYIDAGVCFFQFMAVWAIFNWLDKPDTKMLGLAGILMGMALGAKHSVIPMWGTCGLLVLLAGVLRRDGLRQSAFQVLLFAGVSLALASPWYIRSFIESGNPLWPIYNHLFDGFPHYSVYGGGAGEANAPAQTSAGWLPTVERLQELILGVAVSLWKWSFQPNDLQHAIGPYIVVLLPGLLIYARERRLLFLLGFCLFNYALLVIVIGGVPRYSLYLFALMSVLAGCAAEGLMQGRLRKGRAVLQAGIFVTMAFNLVWNYGLAEASIDYFKQGKTEEQFLLEREGNYRVYQAVNKQLPVDSRVLLQGIVKGYYCEKPYLWDHPYQRVINYADYNTPEKLIERMRELGLTHIVRMIQVPSSRVRLGYPQYFSDEFHEAFRKKYLQLLYKDESFVLFAIKYP